MFSLDIPDNNLTSLHPRMYVNMWGERVVYSKLCSGTLTSHEVPGLEPGKTCSILTELEESVWAPLIYFLALIGCPSLVPILFL